MPRSTRRMAAPRSVTIRELWRCPSCGAGFVTANQSHSCGRFDVEKLFSGKAPAVRAAFDRLSAIVRDVGPVEVLPQKTRVVFMTRMRFIAVMPRRQWLDGHLVLARRFTDPRFHSIVRFGPSTYLHTFRAADAAFFDRTFAALVRESYIRGLQEHGAGPRHRLTGRRFR